MTIGEEKVVHARYLVEKRHMHSVAYIHEKTWGKTRIPTLRAKGEVGGVASLEMRTRVSTSGKKSVHFSVNDDLYLPEQDGTSGFVESEEFAAWVESKFPRKDWAKKPPLLMMWHSHVNGGVTPSDADIRNINAMCMMGGVFMTLIVNKSGSKYCRVDYNVPAKANPLMPHLPIYLMPEVLIYREPVLTTEEIKELQAQFDERVAEDPEDHKIIGKDLDRLMEVAAGDPNDRITQAAIRALDKEQERAKTRVVHQSKLRAVPRQAPQGNTVGVITSGKKSDTVDKRCSCVTCYGKLITAEEQYLGICQECSEMGIYGIGALS